MRYGKLKEGWLLTLKSIILDPKILINSRRAGSIIKRGLKFKI
jgi:hypothetical protein